MKFYLNKQTGVVATICYGEINDPAFRELKANDTDAALEKHVPVVAVDGDTVKVDVGSVAHPMTEEHLIAGIYLETTNGFQEVRLFPNRPPKAEFKLAAGEKPVAVYEFCTLHGLWVTNL